MGNNSFYLNFRSLRKRVFYPLISLITIVSLCLATPTIARGISIGDILRRVLVPTAQIIQLSNISDRQEIKLGKQINQQLLRSDVKLYRDRDINNYIKRIGKRLEVHNTRKKIPYVFQVVKDDSINAFATMGGYVYINTGLIKAAENEAELASVVGHEIAHIQNKDAVKQMRQTAIARGLATAAGVEQSQLANIGYELAIRRRSSRAAERNADRSGLRMLTEAGYAPQGMVSFMKKLQSKSRNSAPAFLSTHPSPASRVQYLQSWVNAEPRKGNDGLSKTTYRRNIRRLL